MILYILKMTLCASLFLLVYHFLLEKEKMHHFKRAFLIISLAFSIAVPLMEMEITPNTSSVVESMIVFENIYNQSANIPINKNLADKEVIVPFTAADKVSSNKAFPIENLIIALYLLGAFLGASRFCVNLYRLTISIKKNDIVQYYNAKLVLIEREIIPYSFLNYIFVCKNDYENKRIKKEILLHEFTHIKQKHSLDILFIELLSILFWFNPVIYWYKSKIRLNHEFLADENAISHCEDISHYQLMLLNEINKNNKLSLASNFNYSITKKRLIMITKISSRKVMLLKVATIVPLFIAAIILFSTKVSALPKNDFYITVGEEKFSYPVYKDNLTVYQALAISGLKINDLSEVSFERYLSSNSTLSAIFDLTKNDILSTEFYYIKGGDEIIIPESGISQDEIGEYNQIVGKYLKSDNGADKVEWNSFDLTKEDENRLYPLYIRMTKEQRIGVNVHFNGPLTALKLRSPNNDEWKSCIKPTNKIWLDGKEVKGEDLSNYSRNNIIYFVYRWAKKEGEVSRAYLWTKEGYDNYKAEYKNGISEADLLSIPPFPLFMTGRHISKAKQ
ncbi:MAG: M56 family metallopeptidase [Prevotella sp.]|jgi:beta-lactamase regulating signal transducer with metallopeptidase domain|nr:M56 family metallopeptidase [Prevotella sp.]